MILLSFVVFIFVSCQPPDSSRITFGEKSLAFYKLSQDEKVRESEIWKVDPKREQAINSIANGQFGQALTTLGKYLQSEPQPNDPEARIFLNNLKVEKPYDTIAVSMPFSSKLEKSLEVLRGVAQAQSDWNTKNYKLRRDSEPWLKIGIADDDDNDPNNGTKIAEKVATELAKRKEILGVVGHFSSQASRETNLIYQEDQLVSISPTSTSVSLTNIPYFFRTVPNDQLAAKALVKYAKKKFDPVKAVVFYNSDSDYSKSLRKEFIRELGNSNIVRRDDDLDWDMSGWNSEHWDDEAAQFLKEAREKSANLLMLAPSSGYLDRALAIVRVNNKEEFGFPIVAGDAVYSDDICEEGENALGIVIAVASHIDPNKPKPPWVKDYERLWGKGENQKVVSWRTIAAYDATLALAKAINNQNKDNDLAQPTREGVKNQLSSIKFQSPVPSRTVKFNDSGDYNGDVQLVKVENNGSGYDCVPINP